MIRDLIHITDVTLRDGLQLEAPVPVDAKLALAEILLLAGYPRLEVTSFSHPKWMPQFADSESFCQGLFAKPRTNTELMAFVPNQKGLERLLNYPIEWVSAFIATSETFNQKNVNASINSTLINIKSIIDDSHSAGRKARIYVSTVFGCPYEGAIDDEYLHALLTKIAQLGPDEVALSDTIGVALPPQVHAIVGRFAKTFPVAKTALHLHNTYGLALAAAQAGYEEGIRRFDGSSGSIGGCPYAKGATGNVASEELAYLFFRLGALKTFERDAIQQVLAMLSGQLRLSVKSRLQDIWSKGGTLYGIK